MWIRAQLCCPGDPRVYEDGTGAAPHESVRGCVWSGCGAGLEPSGEEVAPVGELVRSSRRVSASVEDAGQTGPVRQGCEDNEATGDVGHHGVGTLHPAAADDDDDDAADALPHLEQTSASAHTR